MTEAWKTWSSWENSAAPWCLAATDTMLSSPLSRRAAFVTYDTPKHPRKPLRRHEARGIACALREDQRHFADDEVAVRLPIDGAEARGFVH